MNSLKAKSAQKQSLPYSLTDDEHCILQGVADTLFMLTNNQNPNEKDRAKTAMENCLNAMREQLDTVLAFKGMNQ